MRSRLLLLTGLVLIILVALAAAWPYLNQASRASGAVNVYASPVQAGCYIAAPADCRIHVDPFSIALFPGSKLVFFQLITTRIGTGTQTVVYDFHTDQSNPGPAIGDNYSPSLVTQDFAATCGKTYTLSLQGRDTSAATTYNLGGTKQFTCPAGVP